MAFQYITKQQLNGFNNYKYSSKDTSPLSNYVMHPFWNCVVQLFPRWIAPNLMTLTGFLFLITQTLLLTYYDPNFKAGNSLPPWVWFYSAFAHFMAHTLDGCDGKQARRTGSSGPLGEMFDHGLDAWATSLLVINSFSLFGDDVTNDEKYYIIILMCVNFMSSHWEKYNTGILYLPWTYDISQVTMFICYITAGIYGTEMYSRPLFGEINTVHIFKWIIYGGSVFTWAVCIRNVLRVWSNKTGKQTTLYECFLPWVPLVIGFGTITIWCYHLSSFDIMEQRPRLLYSLTGIVFAGISCRLIVVQMSSTRADVFNPMLLPVILICLLDALCRHPYISPFFWIIAFWICLLMHLHYGRGVVSSLAKHLGIKVFKINPTKTN